jgi:hypothetical protein
VGLLQAYRCSSWAAGVVSDLGRVTALLAGDRHGKDVSGHPGPNMVTGKPGQEEIPWQETMSEEICDTQDKGVHFSILGQPCTMLSWS